jgi:hypothetical protein
MGTNAEQYLTLSELKDRGWTQSLITLFLGDPDELRTNPRYRSGPPMKLYGMRRVKKAESSAKFRIAQENRKGRRLAAQKALATKRKKIEEYLETVEIEVPQITKEELIRRVCDNYNAGLVCVIQDRLRAHPNSDSKFLERICVNYLRHCLTEYEDHLKEIAGKVGVHDAYLEIKMMVLDAIAVRYDWLSAECSRQEKRLRDQEMQRILYGL